MADDLQSTRFEGGIQNANELTPEQIEHERATRMERLRAEAEAARQMAERLRIEAAQEDAARLKSLRMHLMSTQAGVLQGRFAVEFPEGQMNELQRDIGGAKRALDSAAKGVLGNDTQPPPPPSSGVRGFEGRSFGSSGISTASFDNVPDSIDLQDRRNEGTVVGVTNIASRRREALRRAKPGPQPETAPAPASSPTSASRLKLDELSDLSDAEINQSMDKLGS